MIAFPDWSGKPVEEQNLLVGTIVDIILDDLLLDDCLLQEIFPDRMIVEDKGRCLAVIRELSLWARDGWTHYLGNLHEYALDGVLWLWQSIEKEEREYLLCSRELDTKFREAAKGIEWESLREVCFEDGDFEDTEIRFRQFYERGALYRYDLTEDDLFFLPRDVREEYRRAQDRYSFWDLVSLLPEIIEDLLVGVGVERLLYNQDGSFRSETDAQVLIEGLLDPFCKLYKISMSREHPVGCGAVDFKLSRDGQQALIELKMFRGKVREITEITRALKHQVPAYQRPFQMEVAFLIVLCLKPAPDALKMLAQNKEVHKIYYQIEREPLIHLIELSNDRVVPSRRSA